MPNFPVRDLASKGILRDPSPYQLDLSAFSNGKNVLFHANKVQAAPIFRTINDTLPQQPVFVAGYEPSSGYDAIFVVGGDGSIQKYQNLTLSDVSANDSVGPIHMVVGGSGYVQATPPAVTFSTAAGPNAVTATGVAIVTSGGVVFGIVVTNAGYYPAGTAPTITIDAPVSGTTATATCTLVGFPGGAGATQKTTYCELGSVGYINFPGLAPQFFGPESLSFEPIPNRESAWTCRSLRAYGDYLIALNVTKPSTWVSPFSGATIAGGDSPSLFKWSDVVLNGNTPGSWDPTDPRTSAGENPLEGLTSPLVDGLPMRNLFVVYSETEIWAAEQTGTQSVFQFQQLFSNGGLISPNCVVEVDGVHYCFGPVDIYKHDGSEKVSLVDKRNRQSIYRNLNVEAAEACFVQYIPHLDSVLFAYQTGDTTFTFRNGGSTGCNAGALYDISNDTWTFIDLPNVRAFAMANCDTIYTYNSIPSNYTYANFGGSYYDQQNTFRKSAVTVSVSPEASPPISKNRLLGYDFMDVGWLGFAYEPEVNTQAFVERTGIALDQLGSDLTTYKRLRRIFPLVASLNPAIQVQVQIGYSNTPAGQVTWGAVQSFNPITQYKIDTITGGRYLAIRFLIPTPADFEIAGFDADVSDGGRR